MKKEIKIFVVGGLRAAAVCASLRKKHVGVRYFPNERECLKSIEHNPDILIVDEALKEFDPISFLSSITVLSNAHVIFLSRNQHFTNMKKAFKSGASDYIIKDAYLHFSINEFVTRFLNRTNSLSNKISTYDCRGDSNLKFVHPVRFKLFQRLTRP